MIQPKVWANALRTIPRISKEEWNSYDIISRWLIATRSAVFILTALSALVGGLLAYRDGNINWFYFLVATLGLILAHASNNLINDLIDFNKGIDKDNYYRAQYGPQPLEHGLVSKRTFYMYIAVSLVLAMMAGIYLVLNTGPLTPILVVVGLFFLFFYTWPLKYIGMGEPTVLLVWGPLMIGGTYYVVSGSVWSWEAVLAGLVYAIGPTSVLFGKHTDKLKEDRVKGVYTLPVILGERISRYVNISIWGFQYVLLGYLIITGRMTIAMLIVFLAIPKYIWAVKIFSRPRPEKEPEDLGPGIWPLYLSAHAFAYNKRFGGLFLLGLILDIVLVKLNISLF